MRAGGLGFNIPNQSVTVVKNEFNLVKKNETLVVQVPTDSTKRYSMRNIVFSRSFIVGCSLMTLLSMMSAGILTWYLFTI